MRRLSLLLAILALCVGPLSAPASPGTPLAIPSATGCVAPDEPAAEAADESGVELPAPGTPADPATIDQVAAAVATLIACRNAGDFATYAALLTSNARFEASGDTDPAVLIAQLQAFDRPLTVRSLGDVQRHADGRLSVVLTYLFGPYELRRERWYLTEHDGSLRLDATAIGSAVPPESAADITVVVVDGAILLDPTSVAAAPHLVVQAENGGEQAHELLVARLPGGTDAATLVAQGEAAVLAAFAGAVFLLPGSGAELVLADLPPGEYALVCLLTTPDGALHAATGEIATLTVEATATPPASG